jgi:NADPH2:quinone reductase
MKAIRVHQYGGPEVLKWEDAPDPKPAAGQVLVRRCAIGVNPVDTYVRSGNYTDNTTLPFTPGSDGAGVVEAVGNGVKHFKRGARVYMFATTSGSRAGAYAELAVCTPSQIYPLPGNTSFAQGAAIGVPYGTAYRARFFKRRGRFPVKLSLFTGRAAAWASPPCNSPSPMDCASLARPAATADVRWWQNKARSMWSITARLTISKR